MLFILGACLVAWTITISLYISEVWHRRWEEWELRGKNIPQSWRLKNCLEPLYGGIFIFITGFLVGIIFTSVLGITLADLP